MSSTITTASLPHILLLGATGRTGRLQNLVDEEVKKSGLKYVMVRPAMLKGEGVAPIKPLGDQGGKAGVMPSVSANCVAGFLLDVAVNEEWDCRTLVISD